MNFNLVFPLVLFNFISLFAIDNSNHLLDSTNALADQMQETGLPVVNNMINGTNMRPRSFRTSEIIPFGRLAIINSLGLESLHISGSSQPSPNEMDEIKRFWGKRKIHWITLRKEEVWAVQARGAAVMVSQLHPLKWWTGEDPQGVRSIEQLHADEIKLLDAIPANSLVQLYGNRDLEPTLEGGEAYEILYSLEIEAEKTFTLQQLVEQKGMDYYRVSDNKFGPISWESIDQLVRIIREIPVEDAVHFHCKKGQSRTTIAMVLYDMMRNAGKVSAQEIIKRQGPEGLGGASIEANDVTQGKSGVPYKHSWEPTLIKFYQYCIENKHTNFVLSFSEWCEQKGIEREAEIALEEFSKSLNIISTLPEPFVKVFDPATAEDSEKFPGPIVLTVLDEGKQLPSNLRSMSDHHLNASFNSEGLNRLRVVASSQPTAQSAKLLFEQIKKAFPGKKIIDVDLRHDEHWIMYSGNNGHDVNTYESFAELSVEWTAEELMQRELSRAEFLTSQGPLRLHVVKEQYPKNEYKKLYSLVLHPTLIQTEQQMVESLGITYVRIPAPRFGTIVEANVEQQIQLRMDNPEAIIYYHCKNGKSRTTLALCIEDMMENADQVSWVEIVRRQYNLGGSNLFDITSKDPTWHQEREFKQEWLLFLVRFHAYCKEQKSVGFTMPWGEWSKEHPGLPADVSQIDLNNVMIDKTQQLK